MAWNYEKINQDMEILKQRIESCQDEEQKRMLQYDYLKYLNMIKTLSTEPKKTAYVDTYNECCANNQSLQSYLRASLHTLLKPENLSSIKCVASNVDIQSVSSCHCSKKLVMTRKEYMEFVLSFFNDSYIPNKEIFSELSRNVYIREKKLKTGNYGYCVHIESSNDFYIFTKYYSNEHLPVLVHELMHAYDIYTINHYYNRSSANYHNSIFVECMPKLYELLYCDYLYDEGYKKQALSLKSRIFDDTKIISENMSWIAERFQETYEEKDGKFDYNYSCKHNISNFCSDMLAYYLYNLYYSDYEAFKMATEDYYKYLGVIDEEIFQMAGKIDILNAYNESLTANNELIRKKDIIR